MNHHLLLSRTAILVTVCSSLFAASPAWAHKVIASGYAAGDAIEGEIGFSNGDLVPNATIVVTRPDGRSLGTVKTDADGFFRFIPTEAVPHIFTSDLGAGHVAEFRMEVAELPRALQNGATSVGTPPGTTSSPMVPTNAAPMAGIDSQALRELVAQAVRDEVRPLRREMITTREETSIQSILGGLGTILGFVGVVYFMMARRRLAEVQAALSSGTGKTSS